jgi:hypothetical protein
MYVWMCVFDSMLCSFEGPSLSTWKSFKNKIKSLRLKGSFVFEGLLIWVKCQSLFGTMEHAWKSRLQ